MPVIGQETHETAPLIGLDLVPDAIVRLDRDRCIVDLNAEAETLFGRPRRDLLGRQVADALALRRPDGAAVLDAGWHPSAHLRSVRRVPEHVLLASTGAGEVLHLRTTGVYERDARGGVSGAVLAFRRGDGPRSEATGTDLVSTVSHELRWPLTSIKGHGALLLARWDRLPDDQKRHMVAQVDADADRITRLVTELLDVSRIESGRLDLHPRPFALRTLVTTAVDRLQATYSELTCRAEIPAALPPVLVDPDKIDQVVTNLVENAVKHATPDDVRIEAEVHEGVVAVSVRDRGPGIPLDELRAIFRQRYTGRAGRPGGLGLGLWISRRLVELHGGTLTAASRPGEGSTFRFTLPRADRRSGPGSRRGSPPASGGSAAERCPPP